MRMYRPEPVTLRVWVPPVPEVVAEMEVQHGPAGEVCVWNAVAYAVSQFSVPWQIDWVEPRSTSSHCGSEKALDQRVPRLPSTAFEAGKPAFSREDAVAVLFSARLVVPPGGAGGGGLRG